MHPRPLLPSIHLPTVAPVPHRALLSVGGSQSTEFLNGVFSFRVQKHAPFYSGFFNAQGRLLNDVLVYTRLSPPNQPQYILEYDSRPTENPLYHVLKRFVLRAKVKIRDVSSEYDVWQAWRSQTEMPWDVSPRTWRHAASGAVEPMWPAEDSWPWGQDHERLFDRRAPGMGLRMLVRKGEQPQLLQEDYQFATEDAYTKHRILHGVPEGFVDIPPANSFPMDSNLDVMGGVDFRKGCYVGQELTVRTYHTGVVRKRILPVVVHAPFSSSSPAPLDRSFTPGLDIRAVVRPTVDHPVPRPRGTGKLLTNTGGIGLALLRLEHTERVQNDELEFQFEDPETQSTWAVQHWWPDWWPRTPAKDA